MDWYEHPVDVVCDFRQFYGVDVPLSPSDDADVPRLSVLWTGLPRESRTARRMDPSLEWGPGEYLLRDIEFWSHALYWSRTKDARRGGNKPEAVRTPAEVARARERRDRSLASKRSVSLALGIDPGIMDE